MWNGEFRCSGGKKLLGLKYLCNVHGNIHAEKSIHFMDWTSVVHGR